MNTFESTIDVLTPAGRGAVAVIRCHGDVAILDATSESAPLCVARDGRPFAGRPLDRINFARWGEDHPEDVVVCRTDNDEFEIHSHGGTAAVERIRNDLAARLQSGRGWTERSEGSPGAATLNNLIDAAWHAVTQATTLRTADLLLHQAAVAWPQLLKVGHRSLGVESVAESLAWSEFGRHLTEPWTVALVGNPNAGKSSLMNALAGFQRSIVNAAPGTTRDAVTMDVALDGWPVRLIDTAGLRDSTDELEAAGIEKARRVIEAADLVLQVFDATTDAPEVMMGAVAIANKVDLLDGAVYPAADCCVSAKTFQGIPELIATVCRRLIPRFPAPSQPVPVCQIHRRWLKSP